MSNANDKVSLIIKQLMYGTERQPTAVAQKRNTHFEKWFKEDLFLLFQLTNLYENKKRRIELHSNENSRLIYA